MKQDFGNIVHQSVDPVFGVVSSALTNIENLEILKEVNTDMTDNYSCFRIVILC